MIGKNREEVQMGGVKGKTNNPVGRVKGSKNKRTKELEALMEEKLPGWNPVTWMANIAAKGVDPELYQSLAKLLLLLEGVAPKTNNDSRKLNMAKALIEQIASGAGAPQEIRVTCAKEVAHYLFPKRKAVEVKTDAGTLPVRVVQNFGPEECPKCGHKLI